MSFHPSALVCVCSDVLTVLFWAEKDSFETLGCFSEGSCSNGLEALGNSSKVGLSVCL